MILSPMRNRAGTSCLIAAIATCATFGGHAFAAPQIGPLKVYQDWSIGCDNINSCTAAALIPGNGDGGTDAMPAYIYREAGPYALPRIELRLPRQYKGKLQILVDGAPYGWADADGDTATIPPASTTSLFRGFAKGMRLTVWEKGTLLGSISLSGISAALRFMDAQQGRAETPTAIIAVGRKNAATVPAQQSAPTVTYLAPPKKDSAPSSLWREERSAALSVSKCAANQNPVAEAEVARLTDKEELVLMPCGSGAYNFISAPLIATGNPGRRSFRPARFDYKPSGDPDNQVTTLINASWNKETGLLSSYAKGRGLGDCGEAASYVWDGTMFRLTMLERMDTCRGVGEWIRIWTATPHIAQDDKK